MNLAGVERVFELEAPDRADAAPACAALEEQAEALAGGDGDGVEEVRRPVQA